MPDALSRREPEFTDEAINDLDEIEEYISQDNPQSARRLLQRLRAACFTLAEHPYMGRTRPEFGPNLRSFVVPRTSYIILYRPIDDGVQIIHIRQGSQDLRRLFQQ